jgi:hypothetical protein
MRRREEKQMGSKMPHGWESAGRQAKFGNDAWDSLTRLDQRSGIA